MTDRLRRIESVAAMLAVALFAGLFVVGSWSLRGDAGRFPQLVGTITVLLALAEALARSLSPQVYGVPDRASASERRKAAVLLLWFGAALAGLYALGVLVATALFTAIYFRLFAEWRAGMSLLAGLVLAAFFWLAFRVLAGFRLHDGILLGQWL